MGTPFLVLLRNQRHHQHHHGNCDDLGHHAWHEPPAAQLALCESRRHASPGPGRGADCMAITSGPA